MGKRATDGFTIVELLIVIVVIAILAAITIVSFAGIQAQSRDSVRIQDIATLRKALEMYKVQNGRYPAPAANPGLNSWEASVDAGFMASLSSVMSASIKDPINTESSYYAYYRDGAGAQGCPASLGAFYVLRIVNLEVTDGVKASDRGASTACTSLSASRLPTQNQAVFFGFEG